MSTDERKKAVQFDLAQENLSTRVAEYIKEYLLFSGKFENGQKVSEHEVARVLGISRSPVREAFRELQKEGLLDFRARRGAYVVILSEQDVRELYLLRYWIESRLYEVVIQRDALTQEKYDRISEMIKELVGIVESNMDQQRRIVEYSKAALNIHKALWSLSNMKWATQVLTGLYNRIRLAMVLDLNYALDFKKNAFLHFDILDNLRNKNLEGADKALREDMKLYMTS